jgi:hypothetical protein
MKDAPVRKLSHGGGLYNILDANAKWPVPSVGDGATLLHYSDRHAATVVEVQTSGKSIIVAVQRDEATRIDKNDMSESQTYRFERNPDGPITFFRRNKYGRWERVERNTDTGRWVKFGTEGVRFGERDEYFDFNF